MGLPNSSATNLQFPFKKSNTVLPGKKRNMISGGITRGSRGALEKYDIKISIDTAMLVFLDL